MQRLQDTSPVCDAEEDMGRDDTEPSFADKGLVFGELSLNGKR